MHTRVYGLDKNATHRITVDGIAVAYTWEYDYERTQKAAATSVVLCLQAGQEIAIDAAFTKTMDGGPNDMRTVFGATLLYPD